jgi:hypothetical protein
MVKSKKSVNDRSCKDSKRFENEMQLVITAINKVNMTELPCTSNASVDDIDETIVDNITVQVEEGVS